MTELIALIILIGSFSGIAIILFRKIPILSTLPEFDIQPETATSKLTKRIRDIKPLKDFSYEVFLQRMLTKVRILSLRTDKKTFVWLQKLRENAQKKKISENDNYWQEVKKATKESDEDFI